MTSLERSLIVERLLAAFSEPQADLLADTLGLIVEQARGELATRKDMDELRSIVRELVEAQKRTEQRMEELAEAQKRTEQRVEELAEAQRRFEERTEARFTRLETALAELAEAQRRFEERTEARFTRLEAAQARTERKVDQLAEQVGGLSETVGGDIEDIAYIVVHRVLKEELGWKVGELRRVWKRWNGQSREIDLFGEAHDPAHPERKIWIVGEAKHNLSMRAVERFSRTVEMARQNLEGEIFPVCFCYRLRPEVEERILQLGFHLVFSYGKLLRPSPAAEE